MIHGPEPSVIDERTAPLLAAAIGSAWADSNALARPADHPPYRAGNDLRGNRAVSWGLVGSSLLLGLWIGGAQIESSRQLAAHTSARRGSLTESPSRGHPTYGEGAATDARHGGTTMRTSDSMKVAMAGATISAIITAGSGAHDAVQWRVEDGGNGHWYANVPTQAVIGWTAARAAAELQGGYLACPTTMGENDWVWAQVVAPTYTGWDGWIGLYQDQGAEPAGGWKWISGEPANYFSWCGFQPDNSGPENYGNYHGSPKCWNDMAENGCYFGECLVKSYLIEWSADCNGNGIVDFGEIRDGLLPDANHNNIPDCCESAAACCPADLNEDGQVNGPDLGALVAFWGPNPSYGRADITGDGTVNGSDIAALLSAWGPCAN